jgi:uncharacterized membrane protein
MKGLWLVMMVVGLLIVSFLVVRNLSTHQTLGENVSQIEAIDRAKEVSDLMNQKTKEIERSLQRAHQE